MAYNFGEPVVLGLSEPGTYRIEPVWVALTDNEDAVVWADFVESLDEWFGVDLVGPFDLTIADSCP